MVNLVPKNVSPFKFVRYGCRCAGLMNHEGRPWSLLLTGLQLISVNFIGINSIIKVCIGNGKLQIFVQALSTFAIYSQINCKLLNMLYREKDIRNLLDRLDSVRLDILKHDKNIKYLDEADRLGRKYISFIMLLFLTAPFISFLTTTYGGIMDDSDVKRLTFWIWLPWSMRNPGPFMAGNLIATLLQGSGVTIFTAFGIMHITFTFQMTAFLKVLREDLEINGAKDRSLYQQHKLLTQLINDYNEIFAGQICLEMLVSSVMPCGFGFTSIRAIKKRDVSQLDLIHQVFLTMASPCVICPCGQLVSTEMVRLQQSSYMSQWYEEKPKVRRDLLMLMTSATKPTVLNYRLFVRFDHICLASVFQGLYSFFMMIINFDTK